MTSIERVRRVIRGEAVDHLPAQPMAMMFFARNAGIPFIDYTKDGRKMAEAQLKLVADFGLDCLLTCSDPAREVIDLAGEGSVDWFTDQGPAINEDRAALADPARLKTLRVPDPLAPGRMRDRVTSMLQSGQDKDSIAKMLNTDFAWPTTRPIDPLLAELKK